MNTRFKPIPLRTVKWRDLLRLTPAEKAWELTLSLPWFVLLFSDGVAAVSQCAALFAGPAANRSRWRAFCAECVDAGVDARGPSNPSSPPSALSGGGRWGGRDGAVVLVASTAGWAAFFHTIARFGMAAGERIEAAMDCYGAVGSRFGCDVSRFFNGTRGVALARGGNAGGRMLYGVFRCMDGASRVRRTRAGAKTTRAMAEPGFVFNVPSCGAPSFSRRANRASETACP